MYAYVYNQPLNRSDPTGQEGVGCWNNGKGCGGEKSAAQTSEPLEDAGGKVGPVLEGVEQASGLAGKITEVAQVEAAVIGAATDPKKLETHRAMGESLRILGRVSRASTIIEAASEIAQGDLPAAAGTGIDASVGPLATWGVAALGVSPPVAIGVGALVALGAGAVHLGDRIMSPEGTLTPAQQEMHREFERF